MFTLQTTYTGQNMQSNFYFADVLFCFFSICVGVASFSLLTYGDLNTEKQTVSIRVSKVAVFFLILFIYVMCSKIILQSNYSQHETKSQ